VIEKIRTLESEIQSNNSRIEDEERDCDVRLAWKQRTQWTRHLIDLKLRIQEATRPIQTLILELAEAKSEIAFWQRVPTVHGTQRSRFRDETTVKYVAEVRKPELDKIVADLQTKINSLQNKIDVHNAETTVEISAPDLP
jgi:predicted  nucleic acid-binding Zn-ribbon protein